MGWRIALGICAKALDGSKTDQSKDDDNGGFEPPEGTFEIPFTVLGVDGSVFCPKTYLKSDGPQSVSTWIW
jgi:hypothetical protein